MQITLGAMSATGTNAILSCVNARIAAYQQAIAMLCGQPYDASYGDFKELRTDDDMPLCIDGCNAAIRELRFMRHQLILWGMGYASNLRLQERR